MKNLVICALLVASAIAEPPVNNRYLPPSSQRGDNYRTTSQDSFAPPSQNYGAPSQTYGAPQSTRFRQTEALDRNGNGFGSQSQAPSRYTQNRAPSQQYGAPQNGASRQYSPSSQYGAPSQQYSAPSQQYGAPSQQSSAPSQQYGAPSQKYSAPSQQYNAPGQSRPSEQYGAPANQYLPPSGQNGNGYAGGDDSNNEPANYSFEYMVQDEESGNDFGHRESRQGDRAEGLYYVLLPDGRKQTVEYEADEDGYKPKISYEDTGRGQGYNSNSQDLTAYRGNSGGNSGGPY